MARNVSRFIESSGNGTGSFDEIGEAAVGQEGRERFARFAVLVRFVEGLNGREDSRDGGFVDLVEFQKAVAESLGAYAEMAFHPENERVRPVAAPRTERIGNKEDCVARKEEAGGEILGEPSIGFCGLEDRFFAVVDKEIEVGKFEGNPEKLFFRCAVAVDDKESAVVVAVVERKALRIAGQFEEEDSNAPVFQQGDVIENDGVADTEERANSRCKGFRAIGGGPEWDGQWDGGFTERPAECLDA